MRVLAFPTPLLQLTLGSLFAVRSVPLLFAFSYFNYVMEFILVSFSCMLNSQVKARMDHGADRTRTLIIDSETLRNLLASHLVFYFLFLL